VTGLDEGLDLIGIQLPHLVGIATQELDHFLRRVKRYMLTGR
jgi:hypothetical protein